LLLHAEIHIAVFAVHSLNSTHCYTILLIPTALYTVHLNAAIVRSEGDLFIVHLTYFVERYSETRQKDASLDLLHASRRGCVLVDPALQSLFLLLQVFQLLFKFVVLGLETIQRKLVRVLVDVFLEHHFLEFGHHGKRLMVVLEVDDVTESGNVLLDLRQARLVLRVHRDV
jgi:hypothetical protein